MERRSAGTEAPPQDSPPAEGVASVPTFNVKHRKRIFDVITVGEDELDDLGSLGQEGALFVALASVFVGGALSNLKELPETREEVVLLVVLLLAAAGVGFAAYSSIRKYRKKLNRIKARANGAS